MNTPDVNVVYVELKTPTPRVELVISQNMHIQQRPNELHVMFLSSLNLYSCVEVD